ncbi:prepilin peptidase [Microbacterium caowuchunii]|uniref:prepilin peptidase n=1 Tax=Microbacterium caowuchunii TaxID=2614638 RepID=UPI001243AFF9|nr:A24 family peptidase [Microbacterium caowuchunii]QEW00318.1 prepilin peptidase [Microbacterium caowuchunii]
MADAGGGGWVPVLLVLAYAGFAVLSLVLAVVDLRFHRLPNRLVLPAYPVALILLGVAAIAGGDPGAIGRAVLGGLLVFTFYLLLRMLQPGGIGGGDVKLAGLVGVLLGFAGWEALAIGVFSGFLCGGLYSMVAIAARRADRRTRVAFGPWMLLGAWIGLAVQMLGR